jgi:hypothetical protein
MVAGSAREELKISTSSGEYPFFQEVSTDRTAMPIFSIV